jgi:hypothetical protein
MFTLRPESIKTFVEDKKIKLPRFQRKATWDEKKNFNLCISVFRDYPLGVVVIKVESGSGKASELQKWLLDGRQRREALGKIKNPENIYDWAKSAIKFKNNDNEDELREKYWAYVRKYIGEDEEDAKNNGDIKNNLEPEQNDVEIEDQQLLTDYNESTPIENNKK